MKIKYSFIGKHPHEKLGRVIYDEFTEDDLIEFAKQKINERMEEQYSEITSFTIEGIEDF